MDYKAPDSGMEKEMLLSNLELLGSEDTLKFVVSSRRDMEKALEILEKYRLVGKTAVYFSPVFGRIQPVEIVDTVYAVTCVSMGNPHAVVFVPDVERLNLAEIGPAFERHAIFPHRVNTEFVQVEGRSSLRMRVWERGSGETLACGTGACASVVAGSLTGRSERTATVRLRGGDLDVRWDQEDDHVYMTGPAVTVFEGEWPEKM